MTDTPETDANDDAWAHNMQYDTFNSLMDTPLEWDECARKLERERDEAREQRDGLRPGIDYASDQLTTVTEQRDRLAEALQKLADCDWVITPHDRMDAVRTIAREALQSLTQNDPDPHRFCRAGGGNNIHCGCKYDS
jgi:hypothetical protein